MLYQKGSLQQSMAVMTTPPQRKTLNAGNQLKVYADLVRLYPDNEAYLRQYADLLIEHGQLTTATEVLRHLYQLLLKDGAPGKADALSHQYPQIGRIRTDSMQEHLAIETLLPSTMRNRLWQRLHTLRIKEGEHLVRKGDQTDALYLVHEGELAEFTSGEKNRPVLLNLIGAGDLVGENAVLQPGRYTAEIVANKDSVLIKLPSKKMAAALLKEPVLKNALQHKMDARNMVTWISLCPLLQDVPLDLRKHMASESSLRQYGAGIMIHKAGERLNHVDLIVRGTAGYLLENNGLIKRLKSLTPGSLVGATSAIHDNGCPADMVSDQSVDILHIPYGSFRSVTEAYPPLRKALLTYAERQQMLLMHSLNELQTQQLR
ncbi:MAG: cyclic nucleotide-binding domain-containing protein [Zetaproteobacteria bacterium CG12_big_fil_rev_8_21_14_0_65_54_13]|nr:MAG: cyclic nucleotide-binding domain-containing protein [Zetaproteobacteria bacterium CG12_big_fil_rev_8_21_14_0_65_54_13]PIX53795.1 MAG: cyclic nucleotide-binding domain-containing protein [Zetaproteobacteria bacterium CG_4_10_14_3_um_filter_54_28]PJA30863.1 MAG: cyclic nucleotide-binding domain-containing protein [Zetaproteobacteria bacterium CG_4_9_14_3_um_filter_54_145]